MNASAPDYEVRFAEEADLPDVLSLLRALIPEDPELGEDAARDRIRTLQSFPGSGVLLGRSGGEPAACCPLIVAPNLTRGGRPIALVENVVTLQKFRRRGFGRRLMQAAIDAAWAADCYKVMLLTDLKNDAAHALYASAGFEKTKLGMQLRRIPKRAAEPQER